MSLSFVDRIAAKDHRAIARALSLIENRAPGVSAWLDDLRSRAGHALLVGVTGSPGAGKSTLVDSLIADARVAGRTVGVLAVDPTSPLTGGALLGDRVRMQAHASDAGVFIRSMATRGEPGGLATTTSDAATVLDAAGFDLVVIETVGVGQNEIAVVSAADVVVLVLVPGTGDDVQALKAGIMEVADIFAINKADRAGVGDLSASVELALALSPRSDGRRPPVVQTVATTGAGVGELSLAIWRFREDAAPLVERRRSARAQARGTDLRLTFDHVAFAANDASALLAFLARSFVAVAGESEVVDEHGVRVQFVDAGAAAIEVLEPSSPDSAIARFLSARGHGLHHVAFRVHDLSSMLASLKADGVRLIDQAPRAGARGTRVAFIHPSSAGGLLVELVEHGRSGGDAG